MDTQSKLEKALRQKKEQLKTAKDYVLEVQASLDDTQRQLNVAKPIVVTEHFILRYLERFLGIDISSIRKELVTKFSDVPVDARLSRVGCHVRHKGHSLLVKDNTTITYLGADSDIC